MKKLIGLVSLVAVTLAVVTGSAWAGDRILMQQAVQKLKAQFPQARFYAQGERIKRIYGQPLAFGANPKETAEQFLLNHAAVFGVKSDDLVLEGFSETDNPVQPLMFERETSTYKFYLFRFAQQKDGIPVFRADLRLLVHSKGDFPLVLAAANLRDLGNFIPDTSSAVRQNLANQEALNLVPSLTSFTDYKSVIWAGIGDKVLEPVLAIAFIGSNDPISQKPERWLFVAHSQTGKILYKENLIIFEDVTGNVSGMATDGPKADYCSDEILMQMPHAEVSIVGGNTSNADENGDFVIPNSGTSEVIVMSPISGSYFNIDNVAGTDETLSQVVTPPGPANIRHNTANNNELVRAQVNGYVQSNIVRNFVLTYNPDYPTISSQTDFPVHVNHTDGYCPGNAWYNYISINFCRSGSGYPNTAWSSIIHHEYGHHIVNCGGSGQGQYGEGMSDSIAMLIADDPIMGYGFVGDCSSGIRTADNTSQYPCEDEIHYCGQLLSGCIWSTRNELFQTQSTEYLNILSNLTVNSIFLHTGTEITPQITIDFLTLDDDDSNIGNGTPHWNEICTGFGAHNMDCPPLEIGLSVSPNEGFSSEGPTGGPFTPESIVYTIENLGNESIEYAVTKSAGWITVTNESGTLSPFGSAAVTVSIHPDVANSLSAGDYTDTLSFVNTTDHVGDTTRNVLLQVGFQVAYEWTFDTDPGWSTEGLWTFGQPIGSGGQYGGPDPTSGYTGSNVYGYNLNGDYENNLPERHLTSTAIDCTGMSNVTLKFWRWLGVEQPLYDHAYVRVSNDGIYWTTIWENSAAVTDRSWTLQEFDISSVADNQPILYLRWTMGTTDLSWRYCGWNIDDIQILAFVEECTSNLDCDDGLYCNGAETCVSGTCQAGVDVDCNDGIACTTDSCNESTDTCDNTPDHGFCDDGLFCNGDETCDTQSDCQAGSDPCLGRQCDEAGDTCYDCETDPDCDDGLYCNGAETCDSGTCQAGVDVDCDDGIACTTDSCNESTDTCDNTPDHGFCDDGLFCNGDETCDTQLDCQAGIDPCPPGEFCDETNDQCIAGIKLSVLEKTSGSNNFVLLNWTGAFAAKTEAKVDIYRDGVQINTVPNNGNYQDKLGKNVTGTFVYWVCEMGTSFCSNTDTAMF